VNVSLVVPVKDEAGSIEPLLESIKRQTVHPEEVIIVDGGSSDETREIVGRWSSEHNYSRVKLLTVAQAMPGYGRNIGIAAARNEWIALTDAGMQVDPHWLEHLIEAVHRDSKLQLVYGNYEPATESFYEQCAALSHVAPKQERPGGMMRGPSIASSLIHRSVWQQVGGFPDLRAAEDRIFMRRIEEHGFNTGWAPKATVVWQLAPGLKATFQKMALYSQHNVWAGEQKYWHYGIARMYVAGLLLAMLLAALNPALLLTLPFLALARPIKSIWQRREGRSIWWVLNPARVMLVAVILLTIDVATVVGWGRAIIRPNGHVARQASGAVSGR
jgi:cellulose synthase/poly-beta-1,6-N-acetylglucosamine synthase-like glycosyltransferase